MSDHILKKFGAEKPGRLKIAMLHNPAGSIRRVNDRNLQFYLFDKVPEYDKYLEEHNAYRKLLEEHGVEVFELSDHVTDNRELMSYLPNLPYMNDTAVITAKGAFLSAMCPGGRQYEEVVVAEALKALGIPILHVFEPGDQFEGFITLSSDTIFVADTERHSKPSIEQFFRFALEHFENIIYAEIPQARRFMHPDMIFNLISDHLGLYFPQAFAKSWLIRKDSRQSIDFASWLKQRKIELLPVSDEEQQKWGTSFIKLEPGHVINYDISLKQETKKALESMGVKFTHFHPDALLSGGGSLRCLTMRLLIE